MAIAVFAGVNILLLVLWVRRKEWLRQGRWRRWAFFGAWNLAAVLLVAEVALLFFPIGLSGVKFAGFHRRPDPILHHSLVPGSRGVVSSPDYRVEYRINSHGLRDREFPLAKPPDVKRLLLLGDSYVEGIGLEWDETIGQRLEGHLEAKARGRWQVVNGGVASYSPTIEYLYLVSKGLGLQPDLVVLVVDNTDVWDDWRYGRTVELAEDGEVKMVRAPEPTGWERASEWVTATVQERFRTYRLWWWGKLAYLQWRHQGEIRFDPHAHTWERMKGDWTPHFKRSVRYLAAIRDLLDSKDIPFLVVVFPYEYMVRPWPGRTEPHATPLHEWVEAAAAGRMAAYLDTTSAFRAHFRDRGTTKGLYYPVDGHLTPEGAKLVARAIADKLVELGWVR